MRRGRSALLLATVFLSGAAVMVVEMTTVRVLQPTFGSTTYVWTNVIAVVLAALSVGYAIGGRVADAKPSAGLLYGILAVGGLLVAATAPLASPLCRWLIPLDVNLENLTSFLTRGSLVATLILFAPPTLLLGMVSPMAIRLLSDEGVGRAAGRVFAISTVGSIAGTYLPTLWFVPEYGSRATLLIASAMLVVPAAAGLVLSSGRRGAPLAVLAVVGLAGTRAFADLRPDRGAPELEAGGRAVVLDERESEYQYLTVREDSYPGNPPFAMKLLTINEGVFTYHSLEVAGLVLTGRRYYDDYALLPILLDVAPGEELRGAVVGLACGVTVRQWTHFWDGLYRVRVDGAEIDPDVIELGRRHFHLPPAGDPTVRAYAVDGRQMLECVPEGTTYHMLVVDAFANEMYTPFHLGTREFFELCRRRLAPGGLFAMNVYAHASSSPNLLALENTLATVFGSCQRVAQHWGGNFLLLARNGGPEEGGGADLMRLLASRVESRFGRRGDVSEWDDLVSQAQWIPENATVVRPDPLRLVLTDDHSPLEHLTDTFVRRAEAEILGR
jgi:predicted membrane-bound spermidine synthase